VSPWSHRELRIVVCPDQITLVQVMRSLTMRGLHRTTQDLHVVSCDSATGAQPWRAALQALETALPRFANGRTAATVILSNHFFRYALVPWRAELADAEEDLSFARHCFAKVYGKAAQQWELRLNQDAPDMPRLASAVDPELLDGLRAVFDGAGIPLQSIQPHLMAAFNGFRGRLQQHNAWFALLEPGNLCLALLQQGRWSRVRSQRIDGAWREELPLILEREAYLADHPSVPHEVYVWDTRPADTTLPEIDLWQLHPLETGVQDRHFAMAMAG
jgi:hypothetical protein